MSILLDQNYGPALADVYIPSTPPPVGGYIVLIWIHGGGWGGAPNITKAGMAGIAKGFSALGYVVVCPDYTLSIPGSEWPAQLLDIMDCLAWIQTGGIPDVSINMAKIGVYGTSAGGHLAAWMGCKMPSGVVCTGAWSGPTDLPLLFVNPDPKSLPQYQAGMDHLFGPSQWTPTDPKLADASPVHQTQALPHLIANDSREFININQPRGYSAHLKSLNVVSELHIYPGTHHGTALAPQAMTDTTKWIRRFLG